jgi:hypothetical protein
MSGKPGGYVGQGVDGVFICVNLRLAAGFSPRFIRSLSRRSLRRRIYSWLVLGANTLTMDSKMVSLAFL